MGYHEIKYKVLSGNKMNTVRKDKYLYKEHKSRLKEMNKNKKCKCINKKENILILFFSVLIIVSSLVNIDKAIMPYCVSDEIGYWTAAAWINQVDWSPLMSHSQYYGWGYGVLLALVFNISNSVTRFKVAIVINACLLVCMFGILVKICNSFWIHNKVRNIFIAGMSTLYSYNLIFAHTNMCENFLALLFLFNIYAFMRFVKKPNWINFGIFTLVLLFEQATHLRSIVCVIALFLVLAYMLWEKKIHIKWVILFLGAVFVVLLIVYFVKDLLVADQYTSVKVLERLTGNEGVVSHLSVFRKAYSFEFWKELVISLIGILFYLICSTAYCIVAFINSMIVEVKSYYINCRTKVNNIDSNYFGKIYICLCFLGALAVDVINSMYPSRIDVLFYGRYVEYVLPIVICIGAKWLIENCENKKIIPIVAISMFSFAKILLIYLNKSQVKSSVILNVGWFSGWITKERINDYSYYTLYPALISFCIIIIFILFCKIKKVELACLVVAICWIVSAERGWINTVEPELKRMNEVIETSVEAKKMEGKLYCVIPINLSAQIEEFVDVSWLQYQMGKTTLYEIDVNDLDKVASHDAVIVWNRDKEYVIYKDKGDMIWNNSRFSIFKILNE